MTRVSDEVSHILFHVEAEAATRDPSQAPGIAERAQKVRDLLEPLKTDTREISRKSLLLQFRQRARQITDVGLENALLSVDENDDGYRIREVLQTWVGKLGLD